MPRPWFGGLSTLRRLGCCCTKRSTDRCRNPSSKTSPREPQSRLISERRKSSQRSRAWPSRPCGARLPQSLKHTVETMPPSATFAQRPKPKDNQLRFGTSGYLSNSHRALKSRVSAQALVSTRWPHEKYFGKRVFPRAGICETIWMGYDWV